MILTHSSADVPDKRSHGHSLCNQAPHYSLPSAACGSSYKGLEVSVRSRLLHRGSERHNLSICWSGVICMPGA